MPKGNSAQNTNSITKNTNTVDLFESVFLTWCGIIPSNTALHKLQKRRPQNFLYCYWKIQTTKILTMVLLKQKIFFSMRYCNWTRIVLNISTGKKIQKQWNLLSVLNKTAPQAVDF